MLSKRMMRLFIALPFVIFIGFISCNKDEDQESEVSIYLHDAPAPDLEKMKIHLKGVSVYSQSSGTWQTLTVSNGIFDLLTLDSSHPAFIGKLKVKGADISQVQLILDSANNVTVNGVTHPLVLDESDLDKLKIKIDQNLNSGSNYKLTIDFKANESVDSSGGIYKLKASLKITVKAI